MIFFFVLIKTINCQHHLMIINVIMLQQERKRHQHGSCMAAENWGRKMSLLSFNWPQLWNCSVFFCRPMHTFYNLSWDRVARLQITHRVCCRNETEQHETFLVELFYRPTSDTGSDWLLQATRIRARGGTHVHHKDPWLQLSSTWLEVRGPDIAASSFNVDLIHLYWTSGAPSETFIT